MSRRSALALTKTQAFHRVSSQLITETAMRTWTLIALSLLMVACSDSDNTSKPKPSPTQLKANITAALAAGNYSAANVVAHTLQARYPNSPEAETIRAGLPEIEARAAKQATAIAKQRAEQAQVGKDAADQARNRKFEGCRASLKKAHALEVLYDLQASVPPKVIVGRTFFQIPIDAKQGFAETVNCFLTVGRDDRYMTFEVFDWQTGKAVGRFYAGSLSMY